MPLNNAKDAIPNIKLSVSIVTYKTPQKTAALVKQIRQYHPTIAIIVSDNTNGEDATSIKEALGEDYANIDFIINPNVGFGKAHNKAIEQAQGDYIAIVNPDIVINGYTLPMLVYFVQEHDVNIAGPALYSAQGLLQQSTWDHPSLFVQLFLRRTPLKYLFRKRMDSYTLQQLDLTKSVQVPWISGAFMLLKGKRYFDPTFFLYLEDADFCRRAGKVFYVPTARAVHEGQHASRRSLRMVGHHLYSVCYYAWKYALKPVRANHP